MYETKFEIMQGIEDGIEMFKKLIKPIMILALFTFLLSAVRIFIEPSYIEMIEGQMVELDKKRQILNQLINILLLPIMGIVSVMLLYYYKEEITEEIPLGEKIVSSFMCSIKMLLATIVLVMPLIVILLVGIFLSIASDTVFVFIITVAIFIILLIVAMPLLMFVYEGMVFDDMGAFQAIKHSIKLVKYNYFRLLLLILLLGGISTIITTSLRFHIIGIVVSMMISAVTSKLYMCINASVYLQARPEEVEICE